MFVAGLHVLVLSLLPQLPNVPAQHWFMRPAQAAQNIAMPENSGAIFQLLRCDDELNWCAPVFPPPPTTKDLSLTVALRDSQPPLNRPAVMRNGKEITKRAMSQMVTTRSMS